MPPDRIGSMAKKRSERRLTRRDAKKIITRLARGIRQGSTYTAKDRDDWGRVRKWDEASRLNLDPYWQRRYEKLRGRGGKVRGQDKEFIYFSEKKTWRDAYAWCQVFKKLQDAVGVEPQTMLEVGPGRDPSLALAAEAVRFSGTFSWLDKARKVVGSLKRKLERLGVGRFEKELIAKDILEFVKTDRRFDLVLLKHFFDDLFIGLHGEGMKHWPRARKREKELTAKILGLIGELQDLLNPEGIIIINEYPARPNYIPGFVKNENVRRRVVAKVIAKLAADKQRLRNISRRIGISSMKGSPVSLFSGSFYIFESVQKKQ